MGAPDTAIDIPGYGKFAIASDASAPLLIVFGGIDVDKVHSGVYMWKFMDPVMSRFHIFVARDNTVNGARSYRALMHAVEEKSLTPSQQILYLFSGGYRPGMDLLPGDGATRFSSIFLVDIWMGVVKKDGKLISAVPDFYTKFVDANAAKVTYVYTAFGANNNKARDHIASKARGILVDGSGMPTHMSTNNVAVGKLP